MRPATRKRTSILLTCILTAALLFGAFTVIANAADVINPSGDPLGYRLKSDNTLMVLGFHDAPVGTDLVIPGEVEYEGETYVVNEIAKRAFRGEEALESVTIPSTVTAIADQAFENCENLHEIIFEEGSGLMYIGNGAFAAKNVENIPAAIDELKLPASLIALGEGAFQCRPVKSFILEDDSELAVIPRGFLAADGLDGRPGEGTESDSIFERVIGEVKRFIQEFFEPTVSTPEDIAKACDCLESIYIGDGNALQLIDMGAFKNQTHLTEIYIGDGREDLVIGFGSFVAAGNNGLAASEGEEELGGIDTLVLPSNLAELEYCAFDSARIENLVFSDHCALTAIPDGFMEVGGYSMNGRPGYEGGFYYDPVQIGANNLKTISFGEDNIIENIGDGAFGNQSHLTDIDFGTAADGVTLTLDYGAFTGAGNNGYLVENGVDEELGEGIETLILPANLEQINNAVFELARIKNLVFSDGCLVSNIPSSFLDPYGPGESHEHPSLDSTSLGANALETVSFGKDNNLQWIGSSAFRNQSHLTAVDFGTPKSDEIRLAINGGAFVGAGNNLYLVDNGIDEELSEGIETLTFPASLERLDSEFMNARIKNLVFSDGCLLSTIPSNFLGSSGTGACHGHPSLDSGPLGGNCLETISFGENNHLTSIQSGAFRNQSHLTSIDFGTPASDDILLSISSGALVGIGNNGYLVEKGVEDELCEGVETLTFPSNLQTLDTALEYARIKNIVFSDDCPLTSITSHFMGLLGSGCNGQPGKQVDYNYDPNVGKSYITNERFVEELPSIAANALETVTFGNNNNISNIYHGAFQNQSHMTSIDFGTSEAELTIWSGAFAGVGNNAYLVENGVDESLGEGIELELPANLVDLKNGAFTFAGLKNVTFADGIGISDVKHGVFQDVNVMEELVLGSDYPSDVLEGGVFSRCPELTTIDLQDSGVTTIEDALKENPKLTKVIFPKDLTTITWAEHPEDRWDQISEDRIDPDYSRDKICPFYGCDNVNVLRFLQADPGEFSFDEGVFQFLNEAGVVYVPLETTDGAIEEYEDLLTDCGLTFAEDRWVIERYIPLESIELDPEEAELVVGDTLEIAAALVPDDATERDVVWSSSDEEVATVDENGVVTAVAPGTAEITAQSAAFKDIKAICAVTVSKPEAPELTVEAPEMSEDSESVETQIEGLPEDIENAEFTVECDNENVTVTVDEDGKITVTNNGAEAGETVKVKITVTSDNYEDAVVEFEFTVAEGETEEYQITVKGGTADKETAREGETVTVTWTAKKNYRFSKWTTKSEGVEFEDAKAESTTFVMPAGDVTVTAKSVSTSSGSSSGDSTPTESIAEEEVPLAPTVPSFIDVDEDDWYRDAVDYVVENGLMEGVGGDRFAPKATTTRAMIVTILWRLEGQPEAKGEMPFTDVPDGQWYSEPIKWAAENGVVEGYGNGIFGMNDYITREQFVTILWRYAKLKDKDVSAAAKLDGYSDVSEISGWASEAMEWAIGSGLMQGRSDSVLAPKGNASRAEAATFFMRFNEMIK